MSDRIIRIEQDTIRRRRPIRDFVAPLLIAAALGAPVSWTLGWPVLRGSVSIVIIGALYQAFRRSGLQCRVLRRHWTPDLQTIKDGFSKLGEANLAVGRSGKVHSCAVACRRCGAEVNVTATADAAFLGIDISR